MSDVGRLAGKVAVITGAAKGMGEHAARLFASEGAKVVITDVDPLGQAVAESIGENSMFVHMDVASEADWSAMIAAATAKFGVPTILLNNAGILEAGDLFSLTSERFEQLLKINVVGCFSGIRLLSPGMIAAGGGSIINVSSTVALLATNGQLGYIASKWALRGMTKAAALELAPHGVRVNSIHPGPINTPMVSDTPMSDHEFGKLFPDLPMQRGGTSTEVAHVSLFLASDDSSYVCGAELAVDGGMGAGTYLRLLPGAPRQ